MLGQPETVHVPVTESGLVELPNVPVPGTNRIQLIRVLAAVAGSTYVNIETLVAGCQVMLVAEQLELATEVFAALLGVPTPVIVIPPIVTVTPAVHVQVVAGKMGTGTVTVSPLIDRFIVACTSDGTQLGAVRVVPHNEGASINARTGIICFSM
jgi:hypothetical protein